MRWEVKGADRRTGEDRQIFVEANDEAQATRRAGRQGLLVESARPLDSNDSMAGGSPQVVQAAVTPPPQLPYAQPVYIMQQAAPQQLWNPGVAALLLFSPAQRRRKKNQWGSKGTCSLGGVKGRSPLP